MRLHPPGTAGTAVLVPHHTYHLDPWGNHHWSPEQISHRLRLEFPDDESMRISHEAIYQSLFIKGRGALKRELVMPAHRKSPPIAA